MKSPVILKINDANTFKRTVMRLEYMSFEETNKFSSTFLDYINNDKKLKSFYQYEPGLDNFAKAIQNRSFEKEKRELLFRVLEKQYKDLSISAAVKKNIEILKSPNTYTITTGHQLNIFTGPLYFIYKIAAVIKLSQELKEKFPEYNFIPVYWMASEDHDYEEISSFRLFGQKYKWETDQKGPVGKFSPESIKSILDKLPERVPVFEKAYLESKTLADATRYYVNDLFGQYGLITIDANENELKSIFQPVIKAELLSHHSNQLVEENSEKLSALGYKTQVYSRMINLFYMEDHLRERIVREDDRFKVLNTDLSFSLEEMVKLTETNPERFSPNVILRPLYQEIILPNLAYIGGPAEIAYWLQLKSTFDHYKADFPILIPRLFALYVNKTNYKKLEKLGITIDKLFMPEHELKDLYIQSNSDVNYVLEEEISSTDKIFESILQKASSIDQSLTGMIASEQTNVRKIISSIEKRLKKSYEGRMETSINQLSGLRERLMPDNNLQERTDNFLNFHINNPDFIDTIITLLDPMNFRFNILMENE